MRCDLMHKDIPVAELDIDEVDGSIGEIVRVLDVDRLPVSSVMDGDVRRDRLRAWWSGRSIPVTRSGIAHLNPHSYGMDGSYEVCGAGMTYLLSKAVDPSNTDLAYLAVVGAVGDFQDSNHSGLTGMNRTIMADAEANGDMVVDMDLRFFGRETRPINQYLQFSSDPQIPGLSDNAAGCLQFLDSMGIRGKDGSRWRVWDDLTREERERATASILELVGPEQESRAFGEMYRFPNMPARTGLRDAKEFATVLNSCGRYDDAGTGLRICRGDMTALKDAERNRADHRKHISSAMSYIRDNHLLRERRFIQWFDAGSEIKETVVGIVAGMVLSSGDCARNIPIIAFADSDDGVKVSARADRSLVDRGLDLSQIMKTASELVGGYGGGHTVAAGATIPPDQKERFLDIVEDLVSSQVE